MLYYSITIQFSLRLINMNSLMMEILNGLGASRSMMSIWQELSSRNTETAKLDSGKTLLSTQWYNYSYL